MITIKNHSDETIEVVQCIDTGTLGCRILGGHEIIMVLKPGEEMTQVGYEPGFMYIYRPVERPEESRE